MGKEKMYRKGKRITSLDEIFEYQYVFLPFGVRHIGFVGSLQTRLLKDYINRGVYVAEIVDPLKHIVTPKNIRQGMMVWYAYYSPFDGEGLELGYIKEIYDDHYIFETPTSDHMYGEYDTEEDDSIAVFIREDAAKAWLKRR